jgi:hypothetical protein
MRALHSGDFVALGLTAAVLAAVVIARKRAGRAGGSGQDFGAAPASSGSEAAFQAFDAAAARGLPVATQSSLWSRYERALRAEGRSIPPRPIFVPRARETAYCNVPEGCPAYSTSSERGALQVNLPSFVVPFRGRVALLDRAEVGKESRLAQYPGGVVLEGTVRRTGYLRQSQLSSTAPPVPLSQREAFLARARALLSKRSDVSTITQPEANEMISIGPALRALGYDTEADQLETIVRIRDAYWRSRPGPLQPPVAS